MNNRVDKPKMTPADLVSKLKSEKGITFTLMSEVEAEKHLGNKNNYLRTASYRKNYDKHTSGAQKGKYIHLDFAYLVELSRLDMYLRSYLLQMCIDVEHALKVAIIADVEQNAAEDGYQIVDGFLHKSPNVLTSIAAKADSLFTGELIQSYFKTCYVFDPNTSAMHMDILNFDCPIWVLVEILTFNDFLRFAEFYDSQYPGRIAIDSKLLNTVRNLRNACAHNNCLLVSLRAGSTKPPQSVSQRIARISSIALQERKNKLSCRPLFEIVCLLMEYEHWVSEPLEMTRLSELKSFAHDRLIEHADFFSDNQIISTSIAFLQKVIDNFA